MADLETLYRGRNVLITGGLGFIGSNLAIKLVSLGANVTLIDSLIPEYGGNLFNIEPVKGRLNVNFSDVRDEHSMKFLVKGQDYLFNLAGQTSHVDSMQNPYADLEINARAQLFILEACRHNNPHIKIVFASTRQIYGKPQYLPADENHPICPVDVNGINKVAGEWYHLVYNNVYKIRSSVLRLTNTYGPRMRIKDARQTFLGIWIKNILEDKPLLVFGDGLQVRDFTFSEDAVDAFLLAGADEKADGNVYNLGGEGRITLRDLAAMMIDLNGSGTSEIVPFPIERKIIDIGDYYSDYKKIKNELGWKPAISIEQGLKISLNYFKEYSSYYR
jgi:nucleoside-diphosphate-sugar epimerase